MDLTTIQPAKVYRHRSLPDILRKIGLGMVTLGAAAGLISLTGAGREQPFLMIALSFGVGIIGAILFFIPQAMEAPAGIKNNNIFFRDITARGLWGWILGIAITTFYVFLYWFPSGIENWIRLVDPLSEMLRGKPSSRWFLYGTFYTLAVTVMGARMLIKYRSNRYQLLRTASVVFFQLVFAFLIPAFLSLMNHPEYYFSYLWPLKYEYLFPGTLVRLMDSPGGLGVSMVWWGIIATFVATPILAYFFGKRWYCSWVCGCGGLAETAGDPFRQLSDKSLKAWRVERWMIHSVLVFVVVTTALLWINSAMEGGLLGNVSYTFARVYGFLIGAVFSGVVGVGFYPIMGSRVWCRFGCPMAAVLGILQKTKSRFRITTNGDQCISCGNCSTYCEMGIDVRWYAQRSQNIIRSSCVGCGVCSAVCPRGVLKLENGPEEGRYNMESQNN